VSVAENHVVHATAVFSELGLAVSTAVLFDPLKWEERAAQADEDEISKHDLMALIKYENRTVQVLLSIVKSPKWTWVKFSLLPIISLAFATGSLFAMAGLIHISERRSLSYAFLSFLVSIMLPILLRKSQARSIVQRKLKAEIK
jgi:hypothetical protein